MTAYAYRRLPVSADEGFPQSFRMTVGAATYVVSLYVNVLDRSLLQSAQPHSVAGVVHAESGVRERRSRGRVRDRRMMDTVVSRVPARSRMMRNPTTTGMMAMIERRCFAGSLEKRYSLDTQMMPSLSKSGAMGTRTD